MRNPLQRPRALLAAGAAAALALTAAACGDSGESDADVTFWHIQNEDPMKSTWAAMADEWSEEAGLTVETSAIAVEDFKTRLSTQTQAGDLPDLYNTWGGGVLAEQVEAGLVRDISGLECLDKVNPITLEAYTIDGKVYAIPFDQGVVGFWYNKDLFAEAGITAPPTTWSEFTAAVQQLKDAGVTPIALGAADKWPVHYYWTYLSMRLVGLEGLQAAGEAGEFSDPGFTEAGRLMAELAAMEPFQEGFESATYGDVDGQAATMGEGIAAMELMGQWAPQVQRDASGTEGPGDALGFFPFPAVEGGPGVTTEFLGGGGGFAAGAGAPDEIEDFMCYLLEEENQARAVQDGNFSTVAANPEEVLPEPTPEQQMVVEAMATATGTQLYLDQAYPPAIGSTINEASEGLVLGEITPEEFVTMVNEAWADEQ
ncbi:extracellular solute-binding protein [Glycomyces sp. TRM65418]|uniref:extracellular solute-binding protein n=1 Tax=Glycomyces sp. TRM65418 TaxID=2867006 RepID=UPI001CE4D187|nr:extracellular solute-binding protein [Glycomyces sp. TRM65418]MCC3764682.1 extracellular solute-binding protein [Glycomyces sp. TRM65418]QZD54341.1 extracellular solute-binding protein [Glycomyces sp. TRM65418]